MKRIYVTKLLALFFLLALSACGANKKSITVLSWPGYDEPEMIDALKKKIGDVDFKFITYTGGEDMLRKYMSNKDKIDLVVVDAEYGKILYDKGELQKLSLKDYPTISKNINENYFNKFKNQKNVAGYNSDGIPYCIVVRWGTIGMVADKALERNINNIGYEIMYSDDLKGKINIFDWYLPNMGVFALMYLDQQGIKQNPYMLSNEQLDDMYEKVMGKIRGNVNVFNPELGMVIESASDDNIKIIPGIGEWAIGDKLLHGNIRKGWYVPKQGGIIWIESMGVPKHINDEKKAIVMKIIEAYTGADIQNLLAWRKAYNSQVPNKAAYNLMTSDQRQVLRYNELESILDKMYFRMVPENNADKWIALWNRFKNGQ